MSIGTHVLAVVLLAYVMIVLLAYDFPWGIYIGMYDDGNITYKSIYMQIKLHSKYKLCISIFQLIDLLDIL